MKFAVFTDLHYDSIPDGDRRLHEFINSVKEQNIDFIIELGDLCHPTLPGGHAELGETNEETLIREFKDEISANIIVNSLQRVGEIFFPWPLGNKPCHQICLYYKIELADDICIPLKGEFWGTEQLEDGSSKLEFSWIDINRIADIELYPVDAKRLIAEEFQGVKHFVYKE